MRICVMPFAPPATKPDRKPGRFERLESDDPASILDKFEQTKAFRLPVIDENKRYLGFITKGAILSEYRKEWLSQ